MADDDNQYAQYYNEGNLSYACPSWAPVLGFMGIAASVALSSEYGIECVCVYVCLCVRSSLFGRQTGSGSARTADLTDSALLICKRCILSFVESTLTQEYVSSLSLSLEQISAEPTARPRLVKVSWPWAFDHPIC